jgi:hypothetical protein
VSLISSDELPYVVPDFAADAELRAQYNTVAKSLLATAIADALRRMREEHELLRLRLEANKRASETVLAALERHAHATRSKYARIVPKQRTASGLVAPPTLFFDTLLTMGQANKLYAQAVEAASLKRDAMVKVRSTSRELAAHLGKIESGLVVRELEVRKHFKSENGRLELEMDPRLKDLAVRCAAIELERDDYNARLLAGSVSDEEQRDRSMAHDGYRYLDGDVRALHCLHQREIRFGALRYLMFRDGDDRIWLLEYGLDMLPLTQMRFDVIYQNERYLIQRSPPPGRLDGEKKRRITHEGIDPRQYMGADPLLRQALRNFVVREKSGG